MRQYEEVLEATVLTPWEEGYIDGLRAYSWWKDGTQYVGTTGTTLAAAVERLLREWGKWPA